MVLIKLRGKLLKNIFFSGKFDCDEDAVKIAVLYFVMMYFFTSPKDKFVIKEYLDIMDAGLFNEYYWGRDIFSFTMKSMKGKMLRVQKKGVGYHYYRLNGFPLVLQVWFYECCEYCKNVLAYHGSSTILRILNWHFGLSRRFYNSSYIELAYKYYFEF